MLCWSKEARLPAQFFVQDDTVRSPPCSPGGWSQCWRSSDFGRHALRLPDHRGVMCVLELRLCSSNHGAVGVGRGVQDRRVSIWTGGSWEQDIVEVRRKGAPLQQSVGPRQRWQAGWLPKCSQAEVTRAQSAIHCIHTFNSPSNCAKHCFMDPEHCRSTRDKAYDISTMQENMASSSEESALRRLLSTPEAGMWTKTFLTAMFFLQPHIRCNFLFGDCGQQCSVEESPRFGLLQKKRMSLWPSSRIGSWAECREPVGAGWICSPHQNSGNDNTLVRWVQQSVSLCGLCK